MSASSETTGPSSSEFRQFVQRKAKPGEKRVDSKQTESQKPFLVKSTFSDQHLYISPRVNKTEQGHLGVD